MKCINKITILALSCCILLTSSACKSDDYSYKYSRNLNPPAFLPLKDNSVDGFISSNADVICIDDPVNYLQGIDLSTAKAAGLFDLSNKSVLYSNNIYEELPPASLTKVMTALVALKYGNLDSTVFVSGNCNITESGAQKFGIEQGDSMTLDQALNILLLYSANDVALAIAENVAGTQEEFINLMNSEAQSIGSTHTHFENPHGLNSENHYTTVYDLYLIFNEAVKYDRFVEIINQDSYTSSYTLASGETKEISISTTNQYLKGNQTTPDGIRVIGGKTGTTAAAGNCLIIYSEDSSENKYISVILGDDTRDNLYIDMNTLLSNGNN